MNCNYLEDSSLSVINIFLLVQYFGLRPTNNITISHSYPFLFIANYVMLIDTVVVNMANISVNHQCIQTSFYTYVTK